MFTKTTGIALTLAAIACAVVSPVTLDSDLSILIHNDLQGENQDRPRVVVPLSRINARLQRVLVPGLNQESYS